MSYSTILINLQRPSPLKPNFVGDPNCRKQRRNHVVVCCCPWSESGMKKKKLLVPQDKNTTTPNFKGIINPLPDDSCKRKRKHNFISSFLSMIFNKKGKRKKLPPTPSLLHLLHLFLESRPWRYALTDLANKYGPLVYLELGERSLAIVSSAKIAKEVMRTHDPAYADRPKLLGSHIMSYNGEDILFHQYDEYWKQMRSLCISELLSTKKVGSFEHVREEESSAVVDSIRGSCGSGVPFNLSDIIKSYTFTVVCRSMFGRVGVDKGEALMSITEAVELAGSTSVTDLFPSLDFLSNWQKVQLEKSRRRLDKMFEGLIDIEQRSKDGTGEHFIDVLLRFKENGELRYPITDDNINPLLFDMVLGGTDSSSSTAEWAMAELMKNPRVMAKAQGEIRQAFQGNKTIQESEIGRLKYLKLVIMETLRLHPSVPLTLRSCREEVEVDGYHIPLKTAVVINIWAIGRDPTYWKNPKSFEPERFEENPGAPFEFIPFGTGKRMCPGKTFALAQIEFILAQLLYHFDWELPPGINCDDLDMSDLGGIVVSRKFPLNLIAKPYC